MAIGGIASIKELDNFDEDGATMKLSEEKEFKKFLKAGKAVLPKFCSISDAGHQLGLHQSGVDAKYLMSRKRKNLMQIARNSMTLLCDFSTRSTSKGKTGGVERAMNDLVCCFEYMLNLLRLEYRIQNYMHSQKFPSNQILLIKTGLPVHATSDKKFGIKYLVVKNFELSTWIQKDIKELEDMIESSRNTSLVKPWDIEPGLTCRIHSAFSAGSLARQALQLIPVGHPGRSTKRKLIIIGSLLLILAIVLATSLSLTR